MEFIVKIKKQGKTLRALKAYKRFENDEIKNEILSIDEICDKQKKELINKIDELGFYDFIGVGSFFTDRENNPRIFIQSFFKG